MANTKTLTASADTAQSLFSEIEKMEKALADLKKRLILALPAKYGSDLWWEQGQLIAEKEIKEGKYYVLESVDDLDNPPREIYKK